jgi:hypothetical protein
MSWRLTENQNCQRVARATEPLDDALLRSGTIRYRSKEIRSGSASRRPRMLRYILPPLVVLLHFSIHTGVLIIYPSHFDS